MNTMTTRVSISTVSMVLMLCLATPAEAHTQNEDAMFQDVEGPAGADIFYLAGAGLIPSTSAFHPGEPLTRRELAAWAALSHHFGEGDEDPDVDELADAAVENRLLDSLEGGADYIDINHSIFQGRLTGYPESTPDKEEAARFIAAHLDTPLDGETVLDRLGMHPGPAGKVTRVEAVKNPDGSSSYKLTIGGETHMMYAHGMVLNEPADLNHWKERMVTRSLLRVVNDNVFWQYLESESETGH